MEANDFNDNFSTPDWSTDYDGATAQVPTTDRLTPPPPPTKTAK